MFGRSRFNMRLNGWQRLWLVGTMCLGLWLVGWWPLQSIGTERDSSSWYDRQAIERDFSNPLCRAYQVGPISALSEPPADNYGGTCWHIYKSRQSQENAEVPYTLETYDRHRSAWWLKPYFMAVTLGAVATGLLSAFVYLCGLVVGWIYQEFRRAG